MESKSKAIRAFREEFGSISVRQGIDLRTGSDIGFVMELCINQERELSRAKSDPDASIPDSLLD